MTVEEMFDMMTGANIVCVIPIGSHIHERQFYTEAPTEVLKKKVHNFDIWTYNSYEVHLDIYYEE